MSSCVAAEADGESPLATGTVAPSPIATGQGRGGFTGMYVKRERPSYGALE